MRERELRSSLINVTRRLMSLLVKGAYGLLNSLLTLIKHLTSNLKYNSAKKNTLPQKLLKLSKLLHKRRENYKNR